MDTFATLIISASDASLARQIASSFGTGGDGMWTTGLGQTDQITHYISSGYIPEEFVSLAPSARWEQDDTGVWVQTDYYPGDASAVYAYASQAGIECTLQDIEGIFSRSDCSGQEPFVAMNRLGLKIINPSIE